MWYPYRQYDAATAERCRLVNWVVPADRLLDAAKAVGAKSPTALRFLTQPFNADTIARPASPTWQCRHWRPSSTLTKARGARRRLPKSGPPISANSSRPDNRRAKHTMSSALALVTGAGSGIGEAIALGFAAHGDRVIVADLDKSAAEATARVRPEHITASPVDVADRAQVDTVSDRAQVEVSVPNVVVNAAGWESTGQFFNPTAEFAEKVVASITSGRCTCAAPSGRGRSRPAVPGG